MYPPRLPSPPLVDSADVHLAEDVDEDVIVGAVDVLLTQGSKEVNPVNPREKKWQTTEGKARIARAYAKELNNLVTETKAWRPVDLEKSRQLRTAVPERILRPRPVLTLRHDDEGVEEVKFRCTLQGFKDPDILDLVREGRTASPTMSTNGRAMLLQTLASCKFKMTIGGVKSAFLVADHQERKNGPIYVTMPKDYVMEGHHPDQLFEVVNGYGLGDQPQQWWRTFERFMIEELKFEQHPMDPCIFMLRETVSPELKQYVSKDRVSVIPFSEGAQADLVRGEPGALCGILGVHVDDQINGGRGLLWCEAMEKIRDRFPFSKWVTGQGEFTGSGLTQRAKRSTMQSQQEYA